MSGTASAVGLPFKEAVDYFRQKVSVPAAHWTTLMDEAHARGFAVAGATDDALIADFRAAVDKAIAEGVPYGEFRKTFDDIVKRRGWSHTGKADWRAKIIYNTNLSNAFSAGRYAQATDPAVLAAYPYFEYLHVNCPNPRLQHVAWSGTVLRADDPWWEAHYPPNGWNCHCIVASLGPRQLARRGIDPATLKAPKVEMREYINRTTGVVTRHPAGIDPGFAYNPGLVWKGGGKLPLRAESVVPVDARPAPVLAPHGAQAVAPEVLQRFLAAPKGSVQVGELDPVASHTLGLGRMAVLLSADTLEKQGAAHGDLKPKDYEQLPVLLRTPELTLREDLRHVRVVARAVDDDRVLTAVLKRTGDGKEVYVQSFHTLRAKTLRRFLARDQKVSGHAQQLLDWMERRTR